MKKISVLKCDICQSNVMNLRGEPSLNEFDCSISYGVEAASGRNDTFVRCFKRVVLFACLVLFSMNVSSCFVEKIFE